MIVPETCQVPVLRTRRGAPLRLFREPFSGTSFQEIIFPSGMIHDPFVIGKRRIVIVHADVQMRAELRCFPQAVQ